MTYLKKKERGIVLLSCLVFLLMLLALLKFTMSSARMEEMKAGADFDQMNARAAADIVMQDAEKVIQRINANGASLDQPGETDFSKITKLAVDYWSDDSHITGNGIFNGDTLPCQPYYSCGGINWDTQCGVSDNTKDNAICYGALTGANSLNRAQGKYIIERFMGNGPVMGMGTQDDETIILRVTGVGFSRPTQVADNASRVMLQNTYILSYER